MLKKWLNFRALMKQSFTPEQLDERIKQLDNKNKLIQLIERKGVEIFNAIRRQKPAALALELFQELSSGQKDLIIADILWNSRSVSDFNAVYDTGFFTKKQHIEKFVESAKIIFSPPYSESSQYYLPIITTNNISKYIKITIKNRPFAMQKAAIENLLQPTNDGTSLGRGHTDVAHMLANAMKGTDYEANLISLSEKIRRNDAESINKLRQLTIRPSEKPDNKIDYTNGYPDTEKRTLGESSMLNQAGGDIMEKYSFSDTSKSSLIYKKSWDHGPVDTDEIIRIGEKKYVYIAIRPKGEYQ